MYALRLGTILSNLDMSRSRAPFMYEYESAFIGQFAITQEGDSQQALILSTYHIALETTDT